MSDKNSPDLSPAGLVGLREKAERAKPGPWEYVHAGADCESPHTVFGPWSPDGNRTSIAHTVWNGPQDEATFRFIAAANPATVLALLAAVAELRAACEAALTELQFKRFSEAGRLGIGLTIPELEEKYGITDTMKQLKAALAGKDGSP